LTARGGKGSGGTPPPLPAVRSSNGGRTRWRHPRPGARRRRWLLRTRRSGGKKGCLGGSWGRCGFDGVLGGAFYRPGGRGRGWPEGGRCGGVWRRAMEKPGAAALGACWRGKVMASGHCGHALASSRRSASCREAEGEERGPGRFSPFPSMSHSPGRGRGGWGSTEGESTGMATGLGRTISASSTVV
jgi:hypothetical protein